MNLWTDIRDFLFPRLCLSCGKKLLQSEDGLCISCFSSLPYTHLGNTSGNEMEKCFWGRFPVVRASSLFYYAKGGDVAQILYAMKYHARKKLCCRMGEYMAGELCDSGFFVRNRLSASGSFVLFPDCVSEDITKVSFWRGVYHV